RVYHAELLEAYRAQLPEPGAPWSALRGEPYILEQLLYHLRGAGDPGGVAAAVKDLGYLVLRVASSGRHAAETDVRAAAALRPRADDVAGLLRPLRQWGHVLDAGDPTEVLAATVASRADDAPPGIRKDGLTALLPARYLRPRWPLPTAPGGVAR